MIKVVEQEGIEDITWSMSTFSNQIVLASLIKLSQTAYRDFVTQDMTTKRIKGRDQSVCLSFL